jgi:hypothetical protein
MAGNEGGSVSEDHHFVDPVLCFNGLSRSGQKIPQVNTAFDLGLNDVAIHLIRKMGIRLIQNRLRDGCRNLRAHRRLLSGPRDPSLGLKDYGIAVSNFRTRIRPT